MFSHLKLLFNSLHYNSLKKYINTEMIEFFNFRTRYHIKCVQNYAGIIASKYPSLKNDILTNVKLHDYSKFNSPEEFPYIINTWKYKCSRDNVECYFPEEISYLAELGRFYHILNSHHHPEYWSSINKRDNTHNTSEEMAIPYPIDAYSMPALSIIEMVCDWAAVSDEKGTSLKWWITDVLPTRWKFSASQINLITEITNEIS